MKSNAGCHEFEPNKVAKLQNASCAEQNEEKNSRERCGIATLNKPKIVESLRNSTIYNVSSRMYYKYFPFKGIDYTRNIVFSLIFLQIFFLRNIFRKLRIAMISSSQ